MEKSRTGQLSLSSQTELIHHAYTPPPGFEAPQPAAYKASTVCFPSVAAMRSRTWLDKSSYTYGLHGTPTTYLLEERLAHIEGATECLLATSGLNAIAIVFATFLKAGDVVLIPANVYGPAQTLIKGEFVTWGVKHQVYDPMNLADVAEKLSNPAVKLLWLEAPGSVTLEFPNLIGLIELAQQHKVLTAADNTWGAGCAFNIFSLHQNSPQPLGVDISIQALTKFQSGGGDVLMGAVYTRSQILHHAMKLMHMRFGLGVGVDDVNLVLRSLPTMKMRYEAASKTTLALAQWALTRPEFTQVLHPALPTSVGYEHWRMVCGENGLGSCLFSVIFDERFTQNKVDAFCETLRLFKLGYSWAGPISLVIPYAVSEIRNNHPSYLAKGSLVRFAIGLESGDDLQTDIDHALRSCF